MKVKRYTCSALTATAMVDSKYSLTLTGYGVIATSPIQKGDFILQYVGEEISRETAVARREKRVEQYVFYFPNHTW